MSRATASVLIVDDEPEGPAFTIAAALRKKKLRANVVHPDDLDLGLLATVDVLLVDFDLSHWDQQSPLVNRCASGWSLAALLKDAALRIDERPTPFATALLTSMVGTATDPFTTSHAPHVAAELNGLEWVFDKTNPNVASQVLALGKATQAIRADWSTQNVLGALCVRDTDLLRVDDVLRCRPPTNESLRWQDGLGVIRWMLQRILPFPTFLIDEYHIACRFGLSVRDLHRLLTSTSKIGKTLRRSRYQGILAGFLGGRWWRADVDELLWNLTKGRPSDVGRAREMALMEIGDPEDPISAAGFNLVVCYDSELRPLPHPRQSDEANPIWPDEWPPYAAQPWALRNDIEEYEDLRRISMPFEVV